MIPTGWIHAVFTPQDTLVFGGNFMHGFNIDGQLRIAALERRLRVPLPYRFPFFESLMWHAAAKYTAALKPLLDDNAPGGTAGSLLAGRLPTEHELRGLAALLGHLAVWLSSPAHRESIPADLPDPRAVVVELRRLLEAARLRWRFMADSEALAQPRHMAHSRVTANSAERGNPLTAQQRRERRHLLLSSDDEENEEDEDKAGDWEDGAKKRTPAGGIPRHRSHGAAAVHHGSMSDSDYRGSGSDSGDSAVALGDDARAAGRGAGNGGPVPPLRLQGAARQGALADKYARLKSVCWGCVCVCLERFCFGLFFIGWLLFCGRLGLRLFWSLPLADLCSVYVAQPCSCL